MSLVTKVASIVILGIPGLTLCAYAANELITVRGPLSTSAAPLLALLGGAVIALIGFGKARQPLYASCFLPLPFVFVWTIELKQTSSWLPWLTQPAILIWPLVTYNWCERYYVRKAKSDHEATSFLQDIKNRIAALPRTELETWPNFPAIPPFSVEVPSELSSYKFTIMKDSFPDGRIRIAIQCYRNFFLGSGSMSADGFVSSPDGSYSDLTEQDIWDVT